MPICGVYEITNTVNGRCYVGASESIYTRYRSHVSALNRSSHKTLELQNDWFLFGKKSFTFRILQIEKCVCELPKLEKLWIKRKAMGSNLYNVSMAGGYPTKCPCKVAEWQRIIEEQRT